MRATPFLLLAAVACHGRDPKPTPSALRPEAKSHASLDPEATPVSQDAVRDAKQKLIAKYGEGQHKAIERGVDQVASLWRASDGDLVAFCLEQFVADQQQRDALFERLQAMLEQMAGHFKHWKR